MDGLGLKQLKFIDQKELDCLIFLIDLMAKNKSLNSEKFYLYTLSLINSTKIIEKIF